MERATLWRHTSEARYSYTNSPLGWCILGNRDWRDCKGPEGEKNENIKKQNEEKELEILGMERERGGNGGAGRGGGMRKSPSCEHESKMCICNLSFAALLT